MSGKIENVQGTKERDRLLLIRQLITPQGSTRIEFEHPVVPAFRPGRARDEDVPSPFPATAEVVLSFDDEFDEFSRKLQQLSKE